MRILHITNNYPTKKNLIFGIFVKEQIDSLVDFNINSKILFINARENGKKEYLLAPLRIRKLLKTKNFDVIHCHHSLSAFSLILSLSFCKNIVVSFQNDPAFEFKFLFKLIKSFSNQLIFKNNSKLINNSNSHYLPNGVNMNFFRPIDRNYSCNKLNLDPSKTYILFVSSNYIRTQKRYDRFKEVLKILRKKYSKYDFEELTLINISRDLVPYYFNASSLHLLTSDFEGSPNSVKEAMSCNVPVVSSSVGNVDELLKNVKGSFVCKSNNENDFADLVFKSLNSKDHNGRKKLKEKSLDIQSVAKKLNDIYHQIL